MNKLTYRFTLDTQKNGIQRVLQGFQTGENTARRMEITLKEGPENFILPLANISASMYVKRPSQTDPSINACEIDSENNRISYNVLDQDISEAGLVELQLKVINTVGEDIITLVSAKFGMEVWESNIDDSEAESTTTYTALTEAIAEAEAMKDSAIADLYIDENNIFTVVFGDGTEYTSTVIADAIARIDDVETYALKSEGYAIGKQNGTEVGDTSPYYHNNSKYYSEQASSSATNAATSESNASTSETNASGSATLAESYAKGGTSSRTGEDTDNAKYYKEQASSSASAASGSASTASSKATEAESYAKGGTSSRTGEDTDNAKYYSEQAYSYKGDASSSATSASGSATLAESYAKGGTSSRSGEDTDNAKYYSELAYGYKGDASTSATNAGTSETNASNSASAASGSATTAGQKATLSESYAVGGTSTRTGEDTDNAKYYMEQCQQIAAGMAGGLLPMGTVTFANLPTTGLSAGMMYNISDAFTSDSRFKDGGGKSYPAGTNAYVTADTMWDCFAGSLVTVNNKTGQTITLDGSDLKVTGYSKASSVADVAATDTINQAIGKVEKKIDSAVTGVSSFNSRTGAITPTAHDYDADQVDFDPTGLTYTDATDVQEAIGDIDGAIGTMNDPHTFNVASTDWVSNTDSSTNTAYPYVANITTAYYESGDTPLWEVFGANGIPTATERECIEMIQYADFGASSGTKIILYATDQPTVALVLKAKGH